jgi:UDP-N-acetyl-2-amino-2-deoxyglucuronate dehydrogenase
MLKIAILGTGAISDSHIQAYQKLAAHCQITAFADLFPEKAAEKAAKYGLKAGVYRTHQELLAKESFDAASVCLPPFEHAPAAVDLLNAGRHVLVEKPMAPSLEDCDRMLAAAQASGTILSIVAQNRYRTPMMRLKQMLASGKAGKVLHAQVDSLWWRGGRYYDLWWRGTWEKEGGGCTMNHAVHHVDLFQWMMGLPTELQAISANLSHENSEVEDFSTAVLRYESGAIGQITASLAHHGEEQQLVFQCEKAKLSVPWALKAFRQKENGFPEDDPALAAELQADYDRLPELALTGHDAQAANFVNAILGREPLLVDGAQGRRTIELITAIYQSSHLGQKVKFPMTAADPFYTRAGVLKHARHFHEKTRSVDNFATSEISFGRKL